MKVYTNKSDKLDDRKCLYSEINANDKPRKKAARRKSKKDINDTLNINECLNDFINWLEENSENTIDRGWIDDYLKIIKY
jgi:hypothetical protein